MVIAWAVQQWAGPEVSAGGISDQIPILDIQTTATGQYHDP
jgi:hypothetical protein